MIGGEEFVWPHIRTRAIR